VILTKRQRRDDVFLIGEESLLADLKMPGDQPADEAVTSGDGDLLPPPPSRVPRPAPGARGVALLGLGAAAAATIVALELAPGGAQSQPRPKASARSPRISRPAASAPALAEVPSPSVHPQRSASSRRPKNRPAASRHHAEPEREPTSQVAPEHSSVAAADPPFAPSSGGPSPDSATPEPPTPEPASPEPAVSEPPAEALAPTPSVAASRPGTGSESFGFER
jgi:hypothetical protein